MGYGDEILVVKANLLFSDGMPDGFITIKEKDYIPIILSKGEYVVRTPELENNSGLQQPIPYVWIVNPVTKKVFLYLRAGTGNEARLHKKISGGVGGHIDKKTEEKNSNPVKSAMMREIQEETIMKYYPEPEIVGFLHLNYDVHAVHFGVVAIAKTEEEVKPAEDMASCKFYTIEEVEDLFADPINNIEEWTKISWPFVKNYLLTLTK